MSRAGSRFAATLGLALAAGTLPAACATTSGEGSTTGPTADPATSGTVTVLAAASLGEAFEVLADDFEAEHPGVRVELGLGPSSGLAAQVAAGAPADVLATADERTMAVALEGAGVAGRARPQVFARNRLALAVPGDDPQVTSLLDLGRAGVTFAQCREEVPCGAAARRALDAAGVPGEPVTFESDVRAVLTKVVLGEVDAGLVYASDVRPSARRVLDGAVRAVPIPRRWTSPTSYPIVVLPDRPHRQLAAAFVEHVLSEEGGRVLRDTGFAAP